jgi:hypothetical protein
VFRLASDCVAGEDVVGTWGEELISEGKDARDGARAASGGSIDLFIAGGGVRGDTGSAVVVMAGFGVGRFTRR